MSQREIVDLAQTMAGISRDAARNTIRTMVAAGKLHTAKGERRALLHFPDDEGTAWQSSGVAHKDKPKDQDK
jgi:hypothetical protein